jgi:S-adenosylmethionine/arginine decarboxylase-like enzyme
MERRVMKDDSSSHQRAAMRGGLDGSIRNSPNNAPYGQELIIDLHHCDSSLFTRKHLKRFFTELCTLIDMNRADLHFWDDVGVSDEDRQTDPKTKGTSAVQFILTSTIVVHTLDLLESVYVNVFSCKAFDAQVTEVFVASWFKAKEWKSSSITRH